MACSFTRVAGVVNVICMKWGPLYDARYVNHLRNMVRRHLSLEHRFVCFTDEARGIAPDIEVRPLPEVRVPPGPERYWNKVGIFSKPLADLHGPALCLDLDVVIVANIDCFFGQEGTCCIIRDYRNRQHGRPPSGNTSICRFEIGAHPEVLERFHSDTPAVQQTYLSDQQFISASLRPLTFWPREWCPSFRKECMPAVPSCYFRTAPLPEGARIVVFHGHPKPPDAIRGGFVRGGLLYCRPTRWVAENWR
jgi:hypothetical protein